MERKFDRVVHYDERSKNYPIRTLLEGAQLVSKTWSCYPNLDQGQEGACVGFGWAHELAASPKVVKGVSNTFAQQIYHLAQLVDEWDGENYEGTSVLAGAKTVKDMGYIPEYRWAFNLNDVLLTLGNYGPVVLGLNWYQGMFEPDSNGFIHPTGNILGGHCILARGVAISRKYVRLRNSWGSGWGLSGDCKISFNDLEFLLNNSGEACIPVVRLNPSPAA